MQMITFFIIGILSIGPLASTTFGSSASGSSNPSMTSVVDSTDQSTSERVSKKKVDPVVVTASRIPQSLDSIGRTVYVLTREHLLALPVHSIAEAISYIPGVDVQQRGPFGAQADVSMRGGGFEQTAVLVNGMRISDVQTAHNVLALPFVVADIERIEVVKGGASRLYGPGAMDGAINIILRKSTPTEFIASVVGGDYSHRQASLSAGIHIDKTSLRLSAQTIHHGNYRPSTDLDLLSVGYQIDTRIGEVTLQANGSVVDKKFGAGLFYSPRFPDQWERTVTWLSGLRVIAPLDSNWTLDIGALYRAGGDEFLLRRNDPVFYRNLHTTHSGTLQAMLKGLSDLGGTTIAVEGGYDRIVSSSLGNHERERLGGSLEHTVKIADWLRVTVGANVLAYSDRSPGIGWGADVVHPYASGRLFATVNRSFRIPSYTELFYKDPTSIGDSTLNPETAITTELGWVHEISSALESSVSLFRRDQRDGIDYAFQGDSLPMKATNIQETTINGIDANLTYKVSQDLPWTQIQKMRLGVNLNDAVFSSQVATRYALRQLRWQGIVETTFGLPLDISATFLVRLFERYSDHVLRSTGDIRINVPIFKNNMNTPTLTVMAEVVNIWNASYIEAGFGAVAPRWFRVGISSNLSPM